jgi:hypothetical protein
LPFFDQTHKAEARESLVDAQHAEHAVLVQVTSGNGGESAPMTPKDEMNARIQERQRYLEMLDAAMQSKEAQIHLLCQTGQLESWIRSLVPSQANASTKP